MNNGLGRCLLDDRLVKKGWDRNRLSDITGIDFRQLSAWATNEKVMYPVNLFVVSNVLGCDPRSLYENGYKIIKKVVK